VPFWGNACNPEAAHWRLTFHCPALCACSVANVSVVAASIRTHGATAVDVFKITDSSTGGKLSSEKFEALRRGVAHRARRQAISQSLGHATSSLASASPAAPPPAADMAVIDAACVALPPFKSLINSERQEVRIPGRHAMQLRTACMRVHARCQQRACALRARADPHSLR
jgi:hypothetical protein